MLKKITQFVLMTAAFGFFVFSANSAMAQDRYRDQRREARQEYRQDIRRDRREYREDVRRERRLDNRYYQIQPRVWNYGYYRNRPYYNNNNRYYYRNGRLYRRW